MKEIKILSEEEFEALDDPFKGLFKQNADTKEYWPNIPQSEVSKLAIAEKKSIESLKENNDKLLTEKQKVLDRLKPYEAIGKADEIAERLKNNSPEDVEKLKKDHELKIKSIEDSFGADLTTAQEKAKHARDQLERTLVSNTIQKLRADYEMFPSAADTLEKHIKAVPVEDGSDEFAIKVIDRNGTEILEAGKAITPEQLVQGWIDDPGYKNLFVAGNGGGSGAPANQNRGGGSGVINVSREASKQNPRLYQDAKAQAEKTGATVVFTE